MMYDAWMYTCKYTFPASTAIGNAYNTSNIHRAQIQIPKMHDQLHTNTCKMHPSQDTGTFQMDQALNANA